MSSYLLNLVRELNTLNDDNLAERVIKDSDVQWCLSELQDILEAEQQNITYPGVWMSVDEQLPGEEGVYAVITARNVVTTARFYADRVWPNGYHREATWSRNRKVTHWTYLPALHDRHPPEAAE